MLNIFTLYLNSIWESHKFHIFNPLFDVCMHKTTYFFLNENINFYKTDSNNSTIFKQIWLIDFISISNITRDNYIKLIK